MRRWNGWGDESVASALSDDARAFLLEHVGQAQPPTDATLAEVLACIPPSRLPPHPKVSTDPEERLRASHGQSLGDWLRLRYGRLGPVTDGVAWPQTRQEVRALIQWAQQAGVALLACGGATSVVGHLLPSPDRPTLTMRLGRMRRLLQLDPIAQLALIEAGATGPDLEAQLRAQGWMLGHYPQSFEYATLGGWLATRSSGQQSARYGRIEQLFAGGHLETPLGPWDLPCFPASAAGPDLKEWVLGSEGRIGVITDAWVRVTPVPPKEDFVAVFFPDWSRGEQAVRTMAQAKLGMSMMRLANAVETRTTLAMAGHARAISGLERYLAWRGCGEQKVMLMVGMTGTAAQVTFMRQQARAIWRAHGGVSTGTLLGKKWSSHRFKGVYMRNSLWDAGYAVDTMETAVNWPQVPDMMAAMASAGRSALAAHGESCHAYTHLSHVYAQGSSVYSTFVFRPGPDFDTAWRRWQDLKMAVSKAIVEIGGTISHQHGVGHDHAPYLHHEKGKVGMGALAAMCAYADPGGHLHSGQSVPWAHEARTMQEEGEAHA